MTDCNKVIKDIEYAKDLLQNRPEQDTVDYKVYEVLDDALDLIHDLQSQIAMLVVAQHELCELLKEQEALVAHWDDNTGHWIEGDRNGIDQHTRTTGEMIDTFRCSWCGFYQYWKTPFCPNCGAKMEERRSGMFDKNVVVRALDCCSARPMDCDICPYEGYMDPDGDDYPNCKEKMMIDAMVLLKGDEKNEQV